MLSEHGKGFISLIGTCLFWGVSPLYYAAIVDISAFSILAHRTVWSLVFFVLLLGMQGRLRQLGAAMIGPQRRQITIAALLISGNWLLFIWAVRVGHALETSLGYYIMPLVSVAFGVILLRERLSALQWVAVGLAVLGVLTLTIGLGVAPWISLGVAGSFGTYGLVKKQLDLGPVMSVAAEVAILAPFGLLWLVVDGPGVQFGVDFWQTVLLAGSGVFTAVPLVMFSYGARRVGLATQGVTMYLNPTIQFLCATFILHEAFTQWHLVAFLLIWIALGLYAANLIFATRAARKRLFRARAPL